MTIVFKKCSEETQKLNYFHSARHNLLCDQKKMDHTIWIENSPKILHFFQVVCGVGRADKPLKHQATVPQTLESSLQQWGLKDEAQVAAIRSQIKQKAEAAMKTFMDMEASLSAEQRGGRQAQTDIIGEYPCQ